MGVVQALPTATAVLLVAFIGGAWWLQRSGRPSRNLVMVGFALFAAAVVLADASN